MARPSNAYWDRRAQQRMARYHRGSDSVIAQISTAYDKGQVNIEASIDRILGKFAREGGMTVEEATKLLNEPISRREWAAIKAQYAKVRDPDIRRQLLARLNAPAYAARITRQQALQADMYVQSKLIADAELALSTHGYVNTINEAYYRTMFDMQRGTGLGFDFARIPTKTIQTILKRPWSGQHYSNRIWGNTDVLAAMLSEVVTGGLKSGASLQAMRKEIEERLDVGKHAANRLLRTETTYMANAAEMESYEEAEIERYQFVATLDNRTSEQCQAQDLKIYNVKDAKPNVNMPPMHPYCRSTTIAVIGVKEESNLMRRARDPVTGKTSLVPASMPYPEWYKHYVERAA
ncbi:minor capsid protein [Paenibacillus paeoniae]|uniref:Phage head morphogenesis protein n=1 Tax=Paenibacillus paeoniae TaxID=2292705 RepID=A0A371P081_9BACL|nr:minor capsid protein [Paenibacillus paeoniae]REK69333.1 phage head morphogenesis protein [Paenibacillus paeoniae]